VRGGPLFHMVKKDAAQLFLPYENRIPIGKNHFDMVKFHSRVDSAYETDLFYKLINQSSPFRCLGVTLRAVL
jgi:hypothetical protein